MARLKIGTLIAEVNDRTTLNNQYEILTSSQNGIVSQSNYFNKQIASKNNVGYKIIKRGQFTYRSMSDTGKFYINKLNNIEQGIVSPAYPVFEIISPRITADYLELYFHSKNFQNQISTQSQGSTRLALKFNKLASLVIDVPEIKKQIDTIENIKIIKKQIHSLSDSLKKFDELIKSRFMWQEVTA